MLQSRPVLSILSIITIVVQCSGSTRSAERPSKAVALSAEFRFSKMVAKYYGSPTPALGRLKDAIEDQKTNRDEKAAAAVHILHVADEPSLRVAAFDTLWALLVDGDEKDRAAAESLIPHYAIAARFEGRTYFASLRKKSTRWALCDLLVISADIGQHYHGRLAKLLAECSAVDVLPVLVAIGFSDPYSGIAIAEGMSVSSSPTHRHAAVCASTTFSRIEQTLWPRAEMLICDRLTDNAPHVRSGALDAILWFASDSVGSLRPGLITEKALMNVAVALETDEDIRKASASILAVPTHSGFGKRVVAMLQRADPGSELWETFIPHCALKLVISGEFRQLAPKLLGPLEAQSGERARVTSTIVSTALGNESELPAVEEIATNYADTPIAQAAFVAAFECRPTRAEKVKWAGRGLDSGEDSIVKVAFSCIVRSGLKAEFQAVKPRDHRVRLAAVCAGITQQWGPVIGSISSDLPVEELVIVIHTVATRSPRKYHRRIEDVLVRQLQRRECDVEVTLAALRGIQWCGGHREKTASVIIEKIGSDFTTGSTITTNAILALGHVRSDIAGNFLLGHFGQRLSFTHRSVTANALQHRTRETKGLGKGGE